MKRIITMSVILFAILHSAYTQAQYYKDLTADISWSSADVGAGTTTVVDVQNAYNNARTKENQDLKTNLPAITFPANAVWESMTVNQKALWIINKERVDRGLDPYEAVADEIVEVAQKYCQYLIDNEKTGHTADGHDPQYRLTQNTTINACWERYWENIAYLYSPFTVAPSNALERLIYILIYEDSKSSWGHRQGFFADNFNDNAGSVGKEGLLGTGFVISQEYKTYNYTVFAVFNIIDPCANWVFPPVSLSNIDNNKISVTNTHQYLQVIAEKQLLSVEITDIAGKQIQKVFSNFDKIDISNLTAGVYNVSVCSDSSHCEIFRISHKK